MAPDTLPRLSNDPGAPHNPSNFIETWDTTMTAIEGDGSASGSLDPRFAGVGRIAGDDYFSGDATAPAPPASPALAVRISAGLWLVQGQLVDIDKAFSILGVPDSQADGIYGYVSVHDLGSGVLSLEVAPDHWSTTLHSDWSAQGLACIGKVVTDATHVISVDGTDADVILPARVIRKTLRALITAGTSGEGGGGAIFGTTVPISPDDADENTKAYIDAGDVANLAAMTALVATGGRRPQQTPVDILRHEHAISRQEVGKTQMLLQSLVAQLQVLDIAVVLPVEIGLERSQSANILGTSADTPIYGTGENDYPDHLGPTTLTQNDDGSFSP